MRQIKFRFFHRFANEMSPTFSGWSEDIGINEMFKYCIENDVVALQYTGLKDKNGCGIYERDIVRFGKAVGLIAWHFDGFQIKWITTHAKLYNSHEKISTKITAKKLAMAEVLGNEFQNPELL